MGDRAQPHRRRCTTVGCNPVLQGDAAAAAHRAETGHRTAKWPVRSPEGRKRARQRNRTGYYDQYNVGHKSAAARGLRRNDAEEPTFFGGDEE
jgi:hypothetical protein